MQNGYVKATATWTPPAMFVVRMYASMLQGVITYTVALTNIEQTTSRPENDALVEAS